MLRLYRGHRVSCGRKSERYRRCRCPIYCEGWLGGEYIRKAIGQTNWENATSVVNEWTAARQIAHFERAIPTVKEAIDKHLADAQGRNLKPESLKNIRSVIEGRFFAFCKSKGYARLRQLDVDAVREFRNELSAHYGSPVSAQKRFEYVRAFVRFCHQSEWMPTNPALVVKPLRVEQRDVETFDQDEIERMLQSADTFTARGKFGAGNRRRIRAMILLLRYSGLRISDASMIARDRLQDDKLSLRTIKTGSLVWCPLPKHVVAALEASASDNPKFFFWNGRGRPTSTVKIWECTFQRVFELANIPDEKAFIHNFRHTFATDLLARGVPMEDVALLLGNSVRIVEKHYSHLAKDRRDRLEQRVRALWSAPGAA